MTKLEIRNELLDRYNNLNEELKLTNKELIIFYLLEEVEFLKKTLPKDIIDNIVIESYDVHNNSLYNILNVLNYPMKKRSLRRFTVNVDSYGYLDWIKGIDEYQLPPDYDFNKKYYDLPMNYTAIEFYEIFLLGCNMMKDIIAYIKGDYNKIDIKILYGVFKCYVE